jgi:hypothetical protein
MAAEAEAMREAMAKVVGAEGELKASQALMEASNIIAESPCTLQVYTSSLPHFIPPRSPLLPILRKHVFLYLTKEFLYLRSNFPSSPLSSTTTIRKINILTKTENLGSTIVFYVKVCAFPSLKSAEKLMFKVQLM